MRLEPTRYGRLGDVCRPAIGHSASLCPRFAPVCHPPRSSLEQRNRSANSRQAAQVAAPCNDSRFSWRDSAFAASERCPLRVFLSEESVVRSRDIRCSRMIAIPFQTPPAYYRCATQNKEIDGLSVHPPAVVPQEATLPCPGECDAIPPLQAGRPTARVRNPVSARFVLAPVDVRWPGINHSASRPPH